MLLVPPPEQCLYNTVHEVQTHSFPRGNLLFGYKPLFEKELHIFFTHPFSGAK